MSTTEVQSTDGASSVACYGRIYLVTNTVNGKVYVGQTTRTLKSRWKQHKEAAFRSHKKEYDAPLYRAIRKYGIEAFVLAEITQCSSLDALNQSERTWIASYQSTDSSKGYNATSGGGQGQTYTQEIRAKISASVKKTVNSESRKRSSDAAKKQWQAPGYRQKMSEHSQQRFSDPEVRRQVAEHPEAYAALNAYNRSPEGRKKQSESKRVYWAEHPDALKILKEKALSRLASSEGRAQALQYLEQARARRKALRGEWPPEEVITALLQGLSARDYAAQYKAPGVQGPLPCLAAIPKIYGKSFRELRDGIKGQWPK